MWRLAVIEILNVLKCSYNYIVITVITHWIAHLLKKCLFTFLTLLSLCDFRMIFNENNRFHGLNCIVCFNGICDDHYGKRMRELHIHLDSKVYM